MPQPWDQNSPCPGPSAEAVAGRAVPRVLEAMDHSNWLSYRCTGAVARARPLLVLRNFGSWSYEGGAITRGLWEILAAFPDTGRGVILLLYS